MTTARRRLTLVAVLALGAPTFARPVAEADLELVASEAGFRPSLLKLREGETVRVALRSADGEHCLAVDALRVEKRIQAGRTTFAELTPDKPGRLAFYCCLHPDDARERGTLEVGE